MSRAAKAFVLIGIVLAALVGLSAQVAPSGGRSQTGAAYTYASGDEGWLILRSNDGSAMADLLPAGLPPGQIALINADPSAVLPLRAGAGAVLYGAQVNGVMYVCPQERAIFWTDGTHFWPLSKADLCHFGADTSLYVSSATGLSTNDGLTPASPLPNIQSTWSLAVQAFHVNGHIVTINVADGSYSNEYLSGNIPGVTLTASTHPSARLIGNLSNPSNVAVTVSNGDGAIFANYGAQVYIRGFKVGGVCGSGIGAYGNGTNVDVDTVVFDAITGCGQNHYSAGFGAVLRLTGDETTIGSAACHYFAATGGAVVILPTPWSSGNQVTVNGPGFTSGFACAQYFSLIVVQHAQTFSGSGAAGPRYSAFFGGVIDTGGRGAGYFSGNQPGNLNSGYYR